SDSRLIGITLVPVPLSVKFVGADMVSVQAAFALTLALPPPAEYWASGSTGPKSTLGVSSVSWTAARLVNFTVWLWVSLLGAATARKRQTRREVGAQRQRSRYRDGSATETGTAHGRRPQLARAGGRRRRVLWSDGDTPSRSPCRGKAPRQRGRSESIRVADG